MVSYDVTSLFTCIPTQEAVKMVNKRLLKDNTYMEHLYMEEVESRALITFTATAASHWFRYVDNTWVKIRARAFTELINATDNNIKFTQEDVKGDNLPFLDCAVHTEEDRSLNIEVYRKPTHRSVLAVQLSSPTGAKAGGHQTFKPLGWDHAH